VAQVKMHDGCGICYATPLSLHAWNLVYTFYIMNILFTPQCGTLGWRSITSRMMAVWNATQQRYEMLHGRMAAFAVARRPEPAGPMRIELSYINRTPSTPSDTWLVGYLMCSFDYVIFISSLLLDYILWTNLSQFSLLGKYKEYVLALHTCITHNQ